MERKSKGVLIIILCTLLTFSAQIFLKQGADLLGIITIYTNWRLFVGFTCYGFGALLLIFGLQKGEVSTLYPILATSYVWVTIASSLLFGEALTYWKIAGVIFIVAGITLVSTASTPKSSIKYEEVM